MEDGWIESQNSGFQYFIKHLENSRWKISSLINRVCEKSEWKKENFLLPSYKLLWKETERDNSALKIHEKKVPWKSFSNFRTF